MRTNAKNGGTLDVSEAIRTRVSIPKVSEEPVSRGDVEELLEAAVRAPNHHLTEPWRFIVLTGPALDELGEAMAQRVRKLHEGHEDLEQRVSVELGRPKRAPVIIVLVYTKSTNPKAIEIEDRYSVGAALQNILLAAHGKGLGAYPRTGPAATDPDVARYLGLGEGEEVAAFVYVGHTDDDRPPTRRREASERTEWRGWDGDGTQTPSLNRGAESFS